MNYKYNLRVTYALMQNKHTIIRISEGVCLKIKGWLLDAFSLS